MSHWAGLRRVQTAVALKNCVSQATFLKLVALAYTSDDGRVSQTAEWNCSQLRFQGHCHCHHHFC